MNFLNVQFQLDLPFSLTMYRWLLAEEHTISLEDLVFINPDVYRYFCKLRDILRSKEAIEKDPNLKPHEKIVAIEALKFDGCSISDLGLVFQLPGFANIELRKGGSDINVTIHNLEQYINVSLKNSNGVSKINLIVVYFQLSTHWYLYQGVYRQMESFREGFESVFPLSQLRLFFAEELEAVFCGQSQIAGKWDDKVLAECCRTDHGYTPSSRAIRFLYDIMSEYNHEEQRKFVQFVTGSPRLPVGGKYFHCIFFIFRNMFAKSYGP